MIVSPPGERVGLPDRQPADLLRRRQISFEQRRRQIAHRHVVEAVARLVAGQQRRDVDVEREQIADGVLVFGPVEPAERVGSARIRLRGRRVSSEFPATISVARRSARPAAADRRAASIAFAASGLLSPTHPVACATLWTSSESSASPAVFTLVVVTAGTIPLQHGLLVRDGHLAECGCDRDHHPKTVQHAHRQTTHSCA